MQSVFVIQLILLCFFVCSCSGGGHTPIAEHRDPDFRLVTYNMNFGLSGDLECVLALDEAKADILMLQEITPGWKRSLKRTYSQKYPHQHYITDRAAGGFALLSRFPIGEVRVIPNNISWFPAVLATVRVPHQDIQLLNVHLRPPFSDSGSIVSGQWQTPKVRMREIDLFLEHVDSSKLSIVAGDFNEESGPALRLLQKQGYTNALWHFAPEEKTWRWHLPVVTIRQQLDHIYTGEGLVVTDAWVIDSGRSDHLPLVADVSITANP